MIKPQIKHRARIRFKNDIPAFTNRRGRHCSPAWGAREQGPWATGRRRAPCGPACAAAYGVRYRCTPACGGTRDRCTPASCTGPSQCRPSGGRQAMALQPVHTRRGIVRYRVCHVIRLVPARTQPPRGPAAQRSECHARPHAENLPSCGSIY